jgi:hypothetical protein
LLYEISLLRRLLAERSEYIFDLINWTVSVGAHFLEPEGSWRCGLLVRALLLLEDLLIHQVVIVHVQRQVISCDEEHVYHGISINVSEGEQV